MLMRVKYDDKQVTVRPHAPQIDHALLDEPRECLVDPPESEKQARSAWEAVLQEEARAPFDVIRIGDVKYYLRSHAKPVVCQYAKGSFKLIVSSFPRMWEGEGESPTAALESWIYRFHRRFQQLWPKLPDEMTPADRTEWEVIDREVDVRRTLAEQPLAIRLAAQIVSVDPWRILPYGGVEMSVEPAHAPPEFVAFEKDQWITATCLFDRNTNELRSIAHVASREPISEMSSEEAHSFWNEMPKSSGLPPLSWEDI